MMCAPSNLAETASFGVPSRLTVAAPSVISMMKLGTSARSPVLEVKMDCLAMRIPAAILVLPLGLNCIISMAAMMSSRVLYVVRLKSTFASLANDTAATRIRSELISWSSTKLLMKAWTLPNRSERMLPEVSTRKSTSARPLQPDGGEQELFSSLNLISVHMLNTFVSYKSM